MQTRCHKCLECLRLALYVCSLVADKVQLEIVNVYIEQTLAFENFHYYAVKLSVALFEEIFRIPCGGISLIPTKVSQDSSPRCIVGGTAVAPARHSTDPQYLIVDAIHKSLCLCLVKLLGQHLEVCLVLSNGAERNHTRFTDVGNRCVFGELAVNSYRKTLDELLHTIASIGREIGNLVQKRNSQLKSGSVDGIVAVLDNRDLAKHIRFN